MLTPLLPIPETVLLYPDWFVTNYFKCEQSDLTDKESKSLRALKSFIKTSPDDLFLNAGLV